MLALTEMARLTEVNCLDNFAGFIPILLDLVYQNPSQHPEPALADQRACATALLAILFAHITNREIAYQHDVLERFLWALARFGLNEIAKAHIFDCISEIIENDGLPDRFESPGFLNVLRGNLIEANSVVLPSILGTIDCLYETHWVALWENDVIDDLVDALRSCAFVSKARVFRSLTRFCKLANPDMRKGLVTAGLIELFATILLSLDEGTQTDFIDLLFFCLEFDADFVDALADSDAFREALEGLSQLDNKIMSKGAAEFISAVSGDANRET
jgi:hypothetical protein